MDSSDSPREHTSPQDVYARHLASHRGYPLWIPEPNIELPEVYQEHGLQIGDVGVVVPEEGCFDVLFNICLPADHPLHRANGVPENFQPISFKETDVATYLDVEDAGCVIATSSVTQTESTETRSDYQFSLSSSEGALLILPQGADRRTLRRYRKFGEYARKHAVEWYKFAEEDLDRIIAHDSLYLITGFFKARSWSLASFREVAGAGNFHAQFKVSPIEGNNIAGAYNWSTARALDRRVGPKRYNGKANQAVYISGFKIAVRDEALGRRRIKVTTDVPSVQSQHEEFTSIVETPEEDGDTACPPYAIQGPSTRQLHRTHIQYVPQVSKPFHPSDRINQFLLGREHFARVAITHDSQWTTLLERGLLKLQDLQNWSYLEQTLSGNYHVALHNGAVFLEAIDPAGNGDVWSVNESLDEGVEPEVTPKLEQMSMPSSSSAVDQRLVKREKITTTIFTGGSGGDILSWTNQDARESQLFNSWGVVYRFSTVVSPGGQSTTTLWRPVRVNKEDRVAKLEWASNGGLGRAFIGKAVIPMVDLCRLDPRYPGARAFTAPDGYLYRWRPSSNSPDVLLEDPTGHVVAFFRPTRPTRYQIGDVYAELHFLRNASAGTITHPPMMDMVTVTAMLYRFCQATGL